MGRIEQRRFQRLSIDAEIEYSVLGKNDAEPIVSGTHSISSGGVCILSLIKFETNTLLDIKLYLPVFKKWIYTQGKVAWTKELIIAGKKNNDFYETGIQFVNMDAKDKKAIEEYISSQGHAQNI